MRKPQGLLINGSDKESLSNSKNTVENIKKSHFLSIAGTRKLERAARNIISNSEAVSNTGGRQ